MESKIVVNNILNDIREINEITEKMVQFDTERLYNMASQNKIGNKIMASVPLYLIYIDDTYQRTETFSKAKASEIAANFIEAAYDPIKLNYRDGRFYCPAGQHRIYAHFLMGRKFISAELFCCSYKDEIGIYLTQDDNRSKLTPYDRHKAGLAAGLYVDVKLSEICNYYDVTIGVKANAEHNHLGSITTAKDILAQYGEDGLKWIFDVIEKAEWKNQPKAFNSAIFRALRKVYVSYEKTPSLCKRKLVNIMKKYTPARLQATALVRYPFYEPASALGEYLLDELETKTSTKMA